MPTITSYTTKCDLTLRTNATFGQLVHITFIPVEARR